MEVGVKESRETVVDLDTLGSEWCQPPLPQEAVTYNCKPLIGSFVYFLLRAGECVYVGQTTRLYNRIARHRCDKTFDDVRFIHVEPSQLLVVEGEWIAALKPEYNRECGGARSGSGRKRIHENPVVVSIRLPLHVVANIDAHARLHGKSRNAVILETVDAGLRGRCESDVEKFG